MTLPDIHSDSHHYSFAFCHAYGAPLAKAKFRVAVEDFLVDEKLGFSPSGEGEHIYLHIEKVNQNTQWVVKQLANFSGISAKDIGYCGLKDRFAKTTQWLSLYDPKRLKVDWSQFSSADITILEQSRHEFKLKAGMHASNHFKIRLKDVSNIDDVKIRIKNLEQGVPNYFGEQRFGIEGGNLLAAESLLLNPEKKIKHQRSRKSNHHNKKMRGLMLSAARSYLFNVVLSGRVQQDNWRDVLTGEPEVFSTGPLWGRGRPLVEETLFDIETNALSTYANLCEGLEHVGLKQERRALICQPKKLAFSIERSDLKSHDLLLSFSLKPGEYATSVLREVAELDNFQRQ